MLRFSRRQFLATSAVVVASPKPPNIVFILLDDLGYADLGCYGQKLIQTPNIDRLSSDSTRFTDCYAGGAVCAPSRSVLMTGLHTGHTPIRANAGTVPIREDDFTLPQLLKQAGYATGGFGKWGLGDANSTGSPMRHGFDEFFGYLHQIHAHSYWPDFLRDGDKKLSLPANSQGKHGVYSADLIHKRSLQFVRKHADNPFFLYACYTLPHANFEPPNLGLYSDRDWPLEYKKYAAMVTIADKQVGEILALLDELKLRENTVVFLASDNGGEGEKVKFFGSNGPLRAQKGTVYEGGIRVPMMVRWPGKVKAGAVDRYPWAFCDVLPTLGEIAGVKTPKGLDGISVLPVLTGRSRPERDYLYWEEWKFDRKANALNSQSWQQAARRGNWKAVRPKPGAPVELYDLEKDIGESMDVAASHPETVKQMEHILASAHREPRPHNTGDFDFVTS